MNLKFILTLSAVLFCANSLSATPLQATTTNPLLQKNRVIILTDIEADPDDSESLVRLFLYSNEIDIKGLVATTSTWKKTSIAPASIKKIIQAYGKVQPNLLQHQAGFPTTDYLLNRVKEGLPVYGMLGVGDGKDSEGSEWIIKILSENDSRPLWISVWGGANTLAQALYKIKQTKTKAEATQLISKLRVYAISDQDDSGIWIRNNFPDLFYIVSPGDDYASATWSAINSPINGINNDSISNQWIAKNIQQGHGPLGVVYPDVAWGMEGDTPSFLNLIPNGLNDAEHPNWGGWGGRYELSKPDFATQKKGGSSVPLEPETRAIWTNAVDNYTAFVPKNIGRNIEADTHSFADNKVTLWRWRDDFQNDFAARMTWCTQTFEHANHPPVVVINHEELTVKSGEGFDLDASNSYDPDNDSLSFLWFNYPEAGTYKKLIPVEGTENAHNVYIIAPKVDKEETAHFILKLSDKGSPSLSQYKRVIVHILPN